MTIEPGWIAEGARRPGGGAGADWLGRPGLRGSGTRGGRAGRRLRRRSVALMRGAGWCWCAATAANAVLTGGGQDAVVGWLPEHPAP